MHTILSDDTHSIAFCLLTTQVFCASFSYLQKCIDDSQIHIKVLSPIYFIFLFVTTCIFANFFFLLSLSYEHFCPCLGKPRKKVLFLVPRPLRTYLIYLSTKVFKCFVVPKDRIEDKVFSYRQKVCNQAARISLLQGYIFFKLMWVWGGVGVGVGC